MSSSHRFGKAPEQYDSVTMGRIVRRIEDALNNLDAGVASAKEKAAQALALGNPPPEYKIPDPVPVDGWIEFVQFTDTGTEKARARCHFASGVDIEKYGKQVYDIQVRSSASQNMPATEPWVSYRNGLGDAALWNGFTPGEVVVDTDTNPNEKVYDYEVAIPTVNKGDYNFLTVEMRVVKYVGMQDNSPDPDTPIYQTYFQASHTFDANRTPTLRSLKIISGLFDFATNKWPLNILAQADEDATHIQWDWDTIPYNADDSTLNPGDFGFSSAVDAGYRVFSDLNSGGGHFDPSVEGGATNTIYVIARAYNTSNGTYSQILRYQIDVGFDLSAAGYIDSGAVTADLLERNSQYYSIDIAFSHTSGTNNSVDYVGSIQLQDSYLATISPTKTFSVTLGPSRQTWYAYYDPQVNDPPTKGGPNDLNWTQTGATAREQDRDVITNSGAWPNNYRIFIGIVTFPNTTEAARGEKPWWVVAQQEPVIGGPYVYAAELKSLSIQTGDLRVNDNLIIGSTGADAKTDAYLMIKVATGDTFKFGTNVNDEVDPNKKDGIRLNANNLWYTDGTFKVGDGTNSLYWNGSNLRLDFLETNANITIGNDIYGVGYHGIYIDSDNYWYTYQHTAAQAHKFKVGSATDWIMLWKDGTNDEVGMRCAMAGTGNFKVGSKAIDSLRPGLYIADATGARFATGEVASGVYGTRIYDGLGNTVAEFSSSGFTIGDSTGTTDLSVTGVLDLASTGKITATMGSGYDMTLNTSGLLFENTSLQHSGTYDTYGASWYLFDGGVGWSASATSYGFKAAAATAAYTEMLYTQIRGYDSTPVQTWSITGATGAANFKSLILDGSTSGSTTINAAAVASGTITFQAGTGTVAFLSDIGGGGAPTDATYITQTPNGTLSAEQALSLLGSGIVYNTTGTGVLSIATAGTDYAKPDTAMTVTGLYTYSTGPKITDLTNGIQWANVTTGTSILKNIADGTARTWSLPDATGTIALTSQLHSEVTFAGTPDYLTLSGQQITLNQIDVNADIASTGQITSTWTWDDGVGTDYVSINPTGIITVSDSAGSTTSLNGNIVNVSSGGAYRINGVALSYTDVGAAASSHTHDDRYYTETEVNNLLANVLYHSDVDDTPVNGATTVPVSSNWAYDHAAAADPHTGYRLESVNVTGSEITVTGTLGNLISISTNSIVNSGIPASTVLVDGDIGSTVAAQSHTHTDYAEIAGSETISGAWSFTTAPTVSYLTGLKFTNVTTGTSSLVSAADSSTRTWTLPDATGTVALQPSGSNGYLIYYNNGGLASTSSLTTGNVATSTNSLTFTNKTWQGTAIGATYGGTGKTTWTSGKIAWASATNTIGELSISSTQFGTGSSTLQLNADSGGVAIIKNGSITSSSPGSINRWVPVKIDGNSTNYFIPLVYFV